MNRPLKLSLAIALALGAGQAFALGLGPIVVKSKLNEPLVAEIAVNESSPGEAESLKASLANVDDMKKVGVDTSQLTVPLEFAVADGGNGRTIIRVTSRDVVREPLLAFLIEINWAKGRVLREYNVLLDPPVVVPAVIGSRVVTAPLKEPERAPTKPVQAPGAKPTPTAPVAAAGTEPKAETTPRAPEPARTPAPSGAAGEYGPVASGETLWEIASRTRPERSIGVNQMMVSLLRANPSSFYRDNVNSLKRGAVLRIPSADEVRALTPSEAAAAVAAQNSEWAGARQPVKIADSGKTAPPRTPAPAPVAAATKPSHLELVPPKAGAGKSGADKPGTAGGTDPTAAVRADLARTKEQLTAREQEANELRSRVSDLEKLKADNERLINLKNSQIAELQQKLADLNRQIETQKRELARAAAAPPAAATPPAATAPAATTPAASPSKPPEPTPSKPVETAPVPPPAATTAPTTTPVEPPTTTGEPVKITPLPETKPAKPVPMPETEATPPPAEPAWYTNPMVYGVAGLALILGGLALMLGRRKKAAVFGEEAPSAVEAPSLGDQFARGPLGGARSTAAVAAEKRESDEERALLERLAADPTDTDIQLDLLRLYYLRQDADKFEQAANAMYAQLADPNIPAWARVAEMGRELLPGDPLFAEYPAAVEEEEKFEFGMPETQATPAPVPSAAVDASKTEYEFDFNLNRAAPAAAAATAAGLATRPAPTPPPTPEPERESFDFDLSHETPARGAEPVLETEAVREFDFDTELEEAKIDHVSTQEFRVPEPVRAAPAAAPADSVFGDDDAVGTKLDLARAYLDMGDPDGARSMLQEVLAEGNTSQKDEARRLLTEIG